jgi:hypothetical protein
MLDHPLFALLPIQLLLSFIYFFAFKEREGSGSDALLLEKGGLVEFDSDGLCWKSSTSLAIPTSGGHTG